MIRLADVRKILVFIVVAVLFAFFVNAFIEALYPSPRYEDFCRNKEMYTPMKINIEQNRTCATIEQPTQSELDRCFKAEGYADYNYDAYGCPTKYECNMCQKLYNDAEKKHNMFVFLISAVAGLLAIAAGLYLPVGKDTLTEWIASGFMLGGLITIFVGTIRYYPGMEKIVRPLVLLLEIILVIYVAYKKINDKK